MNGVTAPERRMVTARTGVLISPYTACGKAVYNGRAVWTGCGQRRPRGGQATGDTTSDGGDRGARRPRPRRGVDSDDRRPVGRDRLRSAAGIPEADPVAGDRRG